MIQEHEPFFEDPFPFDPEACCDSVSEAVRSRQNARRRLEQLQELKRLRQDIEDDFLTEF